MIVDSSAVIAIVNLEPDAELMLSTLHAADSTTMGAPTFLESSIVAGPDRQRALDRLLDKALVAIAPFSREEAIAARAAYARYGKNSGSPAKLNFGDCMSYALAKVRDEPLLFKGDDFTHTDITPALPKA